MKLFLATIDEKPAGWERGGNQLVYASSSLRIKWRASLYYNLKDLKKDIQKSIEYRKRKGFDIPRYDWVVVQDE